MTVRGPIDPANMGNTLTHEHVLVDLIGAKLASPDRWNRDEVIEKVLPYLDEVKALGFLTFIDCTPKYLGRDVELLEKLSSASRLQIITNTGYYGGSDNKFLPDHAFTETAEALSNRWIYEWRFGIEKTGIKPGFIKISVNPASLTDISKKLVRAAGLTHLKSGLIIASHTGPAIPAFEQIEILKKEKIDPSAFIWVHAQNEKEKTAYVEAVKMNAWVSLDGVSDENIEDYVDRLMFLKNANVLHRVLISHDAGWYEPGKPGGGNFRGYTAIWKKLFPALKQSGFSNAELNMLIHDNPKNAFTISIKRLKK